MYVTLFQKADSQSHTHIYTHILTCPAIPMTDHFLDHHLWTITAWEDMAPVDSHKQVIWG